eukprot:CAMPEP_0171286700 /NCGR_PEP_ID=MMETSP0790-20130122/69164_1 /TAXON_ID=2925 /ORGANISM="Alexandrium catenella, Strain OF101" /LENGTH=326 /DNA_ID=CAMNT_0011756185 /DNA_START=49 /DNA_END=1026 /DNA_ORIENTATION=+
MRRVQMPSGICGQSAVGLDHSPQGQGRALAGDQALVGVQQPQEAAELLLPFGPVARPEDVARRLRPEDSLDLGLRLRALRRVGHGLLLAVVGERGQLLRALLRRGQQPAHLRVAGLAHEGLPRVGAGAALLGALLAAAVVGALFLAGARRRAIELPARGPAQQPEGQPPDAGQAGQEAQVAQVGDPPAGVSPGAVAARILPVAPSPRRPGGKRVRPPAALLHALAGRVDSGQERSRTFHLAPLGAQRRTASGEVVDGLVHAAKLGEEALAPGQKLALNLILGEPPLCSCDSHLDGPVEIVGRPVDLQVFDGSLPSEPWAPASRLRL